MGWYTSGQNDVRYKWGNVLPLTFGTALGRLRAIPRLHSVAVECGFYEFLGFVEKEAVAQGLEWESMGFDLEVDASGDSVVVPLRLDPEALVGLLKTHVEAHGPTIRQLIGASAGEDADFEDMWVSFDLSWDVDEEDIPALYDWLNETRQDPHPAITPALLSKGEIDDCPWYEPPKVLEATFASLAKEDRSRHFLAVMLGAAAVSGSPFSLHQPDVHEARVELPESATASPLVLLFTLDEHPFLERLAQGFGVPEEIRHCVFYALNQRQEVDLPPEVEPSEDALRAGFEFMHSALVCLREVDGFELAIPSGEGGGQTASVGWHGDASFEQLAAAFQSSGVVPASPVNADFEGLTVEERLEVCRIVFTEREEDMLQGMAYFLDGGECPEEVWADTFVLCWMLFDQLDLPEAELGRLLWMIDRVARHGFAAQ